MQNQSLRIMAVDDDEINLEILTKNLKDAGYKIIGCTSGPEAWDILNAQPDSVDIVLLDKMMPRMSGMEILAKMQKHPILKNVPVIMQTGDVGVEEMKEGLAAGAYYYLCKPFDPGILISLVNAAARDCVQRNNLFEQMKQEKALAMMINEGRFTYRNINEATKLAAALAQKAQQPDRINTALLELMVNAVEHGNLNIGYDKKAKLLAENNLDIEIEKRQNLPENREKVVEVTMKSRGDTIEVTICDEGSGFQWQKFVEFDPMRLTEPNGRGIATSQLMGAEVEYAEPGNKVVCRFKQG